MPAYYIYHCTNCKYTRRRYRNTKTCPECNGELKREEDMTKQERQHRERFLRGEVETAFPKYDIPF